MNAMNGTKGTESKSDLSERFRVCLLLLGFGSLLNKASADPIPPGGSANEWMVLIAPIAFFAINYAVNAAILLAAFKILSIKADQKFPLYVFLVTIVGIFIDLIAFTQHSTAAKFGIAFVLLLLFNSFFVRFVYEVEKQKAIVIGLVMGVLSNPVIYLILAKAVMG